MAETYFAEDSKISDLYTWVYAVDDGDPLARRKYLAGTAGRISMTTAPHIVAALNEFSLCVGEGK